MRNWAERIKTQVITADGVMKVALFGTQTEVVNIYISVNKLAGMGIDPKQVASLLQSQNQIINTGEINAGEQQLRIVRKIYAKPSFFAISAVFNSSNLDTPFSCMVTPYSTSASSMVPRRWVIKMNWVFLVIRRTY